MRNERRKLKENNRKIGGFYEEQAARFLENQGLFVKEKNYRCRMGEVDLIVRDKNYLVFVEVKYRSGPGQGGSLAAVNKAKQRAVSKVARYYLLTHYGSLDIACRFDVVGFDGDGVHWLKNAFDYCT